MKHQALFSLKDKSKKRKCRLLQFLFGALRVKSNLNDYILPLIRAVFFQKTKVKKIKMSSAAILLDALGLMFSSKPCKAITCKWTKLLKWPLILPHFDNVMTLYIDKSVRARPN